MASGEESRTPGLLEQVWRIKQGLPPIPSNDLLAQVDQIKRGAAGPPKNDLTSQAQKARMQAAPTWPRDWDDPSRIRYVSPKFLRSITGEEEPSVHWVAAVRIREVFTGPGLIQRRGSWRFEALTCRIVLSAGDRLDAIAEDLTGDRENWTKIFPQWSREFVLYVGQKIPLILVKGIYRAWSRETWEAAVIDMKWEKYVVLRRAADIASVLGPVRDARERNWELVGSIATALPGATLQGLAEAITRHAEDYTLLDFKGDPSLLKAGDTVDITPLLEKAAGNLPKQEKKAEPSAITGVSADFVSKTAKYTAGWEGRRRDAYPDSKGIMTVGIGFNLEARKEEFKRLLPGVSYDDLIAGRVLLAEEQVDLLFEHDVAQNIRMVVKAVPDFNSLPENVRLVLVDMCHQFGSPWPKLSAAIRSKDYTEVAKQVWSENWVRDTPRRALDHIKVIQEWARQEQLKQRQQDSTGPRQ